MMLTQTSKGIPASSFCLSHLVEDLSCDTVNGKDIFRLNRLLVVRRGIGRHKFCLLDLVFRLAILIAFHHLSLCFLACVDPYATRGGCEADFIVCYGWNR
jgi:hypothetical protein